MKTALTIAGSDSGGGAGIQADIKTMTMNGVFATSAVTALTAQNTTGVTGLWAVEPQTLAAQLDAVFTDLPPDAVKIGMVGGGAQIRVIARALRRYGARSVVVDPVMAATTGAALLRQDALRALETELLPLACLVTPNIPEAELLAGQSIRTPAQMEQAAQRIGAAFGCNVLLKGGHSARGADDLLWLRQSGQIRWFLGRRIPNPNTHGTGCTLSSAIAANLAKGYGLETAVERAKAYLTGALAAMLDLGAGPGPMDHAFALPEEWRR